MDKNELLAMLGLGASPANDSSGGLKVSKAKANAAAAHGPHAVDVDKWEKGRGPALLEKYDSLRNLKIVPDVGGNVSEELRPACVSDFHALAFEPDAKIMDGCQDVMRHDFIKSLTVSDEFRGLKRFTTLNLFNSEIASIQFAEQFDKLHAEVPKKKQQERQHNPADEDEGGIEYQADVMHAAASAAQQAQEEIDLAAGACNTFGIEPGQFQRNNPKGAIELYLKIRNDPTLRKIVEEAGKFRRTAQGQSRNRLAPGYDDMVGVTLGGDVEKLLSSELVKLGIPELEDELLGRIVERQASCRDFRSPKGTKAGPIVVAIDESSSMESAMPCGTRRIDAAKALALGMAWVARNQGRWCALLAWASEGERRTLVLPPNNWPFEELVDWLGGFFAGGTVPPVSDIETLWSQMGCPTGKTDVLLVTDGVFELPDQTVQSFLAWKKKARAKLIGIQVGAGHQVLGGLPKISDTSHAIESLTADSDAAKSALNL